MCKALNSHETNHSEEYYYEQRNKDRNKNMFNKLSDYTRAARTIYLNKAYADSTTIQKIKNTIMHEIIHCFPYCNNHGSEFKKYAKYN